MQKNVPAQKWRVFAFDRTTNAPLTGDAANITAKISKDFGTATATNDTNPTEVEDGYYEFDLTQAETNADDLLILPQSATANIVVVGCPARIATTPASWADGVIQTGDAYDRIGTNGASLTEAGGTGDQFTALGDARLGNLDAAVSSRSSHSAADVWSVGTRELTAFSFTVDTSDAASIAAIEATLTAMKGATFDGSTDSLEALRNRGDAAWITATGFSTLDASGVRSAVGLASANLDTQLGDLPTANENADALLGRSVSNVEGTAPEHSLCTIVLAMLESSVSGATWTIKRTDGSTTHATKTVTTDAAANPITGVN